MLTTHQCEIPGPKVQIYFEETAESAMGVKITLTKLEKTLALGRRDGSQKS
jgi:hypothetical protein